MCPGAQRTPAIADVLATENPDKRIRCALPPCSRSVGSLPIASKAPPSTPGFACDGFLVGTRRMSQLLEGAEVSTDLTQRRLPVLGEPALKLHTATIPIESNRFI